MNDPALEKLLLEALTAMERGPGAPCGQAQADGFPCPELGHDCTDCDYGREALLAWIAENPSDRSQPDPAVGGDW
jgi:hypothetical protein